jgi:hypothetical protein
VADAHRLTIPGGRVGVDPTTGAISGLSVADPGLELIARPDARGLLRLAAPLTEFAGHHAEAGVHGRPDIEPQGEGLRLRYGGFTTAHRTLPVRVEIELEPTDRGLVLRARIHNGSGEPIPQVVFPQLFGLGPAGTADATWLQLGRGRIAPFRELTVRVDDSSFFEQNLYRYFDYGFGPFNMKWLDYGGARGGATLYSRETR